VGTHDAKNGATKGLLPFAKPIMSASGIGVKSAGYAKSTTHCPLRPISEIWPLIVFVVKSGAGHRDSPSRITESHMDSGPNMGVQDQLRGENVWNVTRRAMYTAAPSLNAVSRWP